MYRYIRPPPPCSQHGATHVTGYGDIQTSSGTPALCVRVCVADPLVIRHDGFVTRKKRERWDETPREELVAQNEKRMAHTRRHITPSCDMCLPDERKGFAINAVATIRFMHLSYSSRSANVGK